MISKKDSSSSPLHSLWIIFLIHTEEAGIADQSSVSERDSAVNERTFPQDCDCHSLALLSVGYVQQ